MQSISRATCYSTAPKFVFCQPFEVPIFFPPSLRRRHSLGFVAAYEKSLLAPALSQDIERVVAFQRCTNCVSMYIGRSAAHSLTRSSLAARVDIASRELKIERLYLSAMRLAPPELTELPQMAARAFQNFTPHIWGKSWHKALICLDCRHSNPKSKLLNVHSPCCQIYIAVFDCCSHI